MKERIETLVNQLTNQTWKRVLLFFALALFSAFFHNLENPDELWNYTFANNIRNGLLPYRDFNILQTPFSAVVNALFLLVGGHSLLAFRLTGVLFFTVFGWKLDQTSRTLGSEGIFTPLISVIFICMFFWNVFLEYSCLILFFLVCLMNYDVLWLKQKRKGTVGEQILIGILPGLAMLSKQTFGTFFALASWISVFLICQMQKKNRKETGKMLFFRMLGSSIPCFLFLFYLLATHTFSDFWDLAYKGIFTFSSKYSYISFMKENPLYFFMGALVPVIFLLTIFSMIWNRKNEKGKIALVLLLYAAFGCINMVPMANSYHVMCCSVPVYLLCYTFVPLKWQKILPFRILALLGILGASVFMVIVNPISVISEYDLVTEIKGLRGTFASEEQKQELLEMTEFIENEQEKGNEVYILDNFAALYFLPLNIYHKDLDMFLYGNIGTKTPEECLAETKEHAVIAIGDGSRSNYQFPKTEAEEYVKQFKKEKNIGSFLIYRK